MKKTERQALIREIIKHHIVATQDELGQRLRQQNIRVTQATVSRDIKELMLVKVPVGDGRSRYAFPAESKEGFSRERMGRMFRDAVVGVEDSENLIVITTLPGTANAVASALDGAKWPEIIGTIAGDDTILAVVKPRDAVREIREKLKAMID